MNYKDLMQKLAAIEEGKQVNEMGIPMPGIIAQAIHPEQPKQQDNVTMNVSMNGSGAGGIKDLMDILRAIEHGEEHHAEPEHGATVHPDTHGELGNMIFGEPEMHDHDEPLFGGEDEPVEETMGDDDEHFANSAHGGSGTHTHGIDAVTATGDDLHKGTKGIPRYSPGNNTLKVKEGLIEKLSSLYNEVKTREVLEENVHLDETGATFKHILHTYKRDVMDFENGGEMSDSLYDALYDYYFDDMPYGVKKARDGDPYEWIGDRFADDLGISETVAMNQQVEENQAGHDYQTGEPLKQGPDGKWRNSKGEERDPLNGGPINPGGGAKFRSIMSVPVKEERTEEKDEKGNVVRWKEEGEWVKAKDKEGRGKVTNLSDKARRESEKMSKKDVKETAHHEDDEEKKIRHLMRKYGWSHQEALEYYHYEEHDPKDYEDMEESAKWRDPKYKGQLFTQKKGDSDDYDSIDYGYGIKERPKKDPGQKRSTFDRDTVWTDPLDTRSNLPKHHNDPENWGYGSISSKGDSKGKLTADRRKRMKNDIRGSLGQHHTPNLPEQMNESKELTDIIALTKYLKG